MKEELTEKQSEILKLLTVDKLSVVAIAKKQGVSLQAVYAQIRIISKKGWLKKVYSPNFVRV